MALHDDPEHPANLPYTTRVKVEHPELQPERQKRYRGIAYGFTPWTTPCEIPYLGLQNFEWILKRQTIGDASRYLSDVVRPRPPFRLPRPFYSQLLRATASIPRRI